MRVNELADLLAECGIPSRAYTLNGDETETHCLVHDGDSWVVYYSQRGRRDHALSFSTESDACLGLIDRLLSDFTYSGPGQDRLRAYREAHPGG